MRIDPLTRPKRPFIAPVVKLTVMQIAEWDDPLVTGLESSGPGLGEGDVVGLAGLPSAYETGLAGDVFEVIPITNPFWCPDRQHRLVDGTLNEPSIAARWGRRCKEPGWRCSGRWHRCLSFGRCRLLWWSENVFDPRLTQLGEDGGVMGPVLVGEMGMGVANGFEGLFVGLPQGLDVFYGGACLKSLPQLAIERLGRRAQDRSRLRRGERPANAGLGLGSWFGVC